MRLVELPEDIVLEILAYVEVNDIICLLSTCTSFRDLDSARSLWTSQIKFIQTRYGISLLDSDDLLSMTTQRLKLVATKPYKFECGLRSGSLARQGLELYAPSIPEELVYEVRLVPGGRWLVTASLRMQDEERVKGYMRVWDLKVRGRAESVASWECNPEFPAAIEVQLDRTHPNCVIIFLRSKDETVNLEVLRFNPTDTSACLATVRKLQLTNGCYGGSMLVQGEYTIINPYQRKEPLVWNWLTDYWATFDLSYWPTKIHMVSIDPRGLGIWDPEDSKLYLCGPLDRWMKPRNGHTSYPDRQLPRLHISQQWASAVSESSSSSGPLQMARTAFQRLWPTEMTSITLTQTHPLDVDAIPRVFARTISGHTVGFASPFALAGLFDSNGGSAVLTRQAFQPSDDAKQEMIARQLTSSFDDMVFALCPFSGVIVGVRSTDEIYVWRGDD